MTIQVSVLLINYKSMIGPKRMEFVQSSSEDDQRQPMQQQKNREANNQQQQAQDQSSWYDLGVPVDAFATLNGHTKAVACATVDPKGHRMATGGIDYHVRLWDFHGMNKNMNSFRIIQPFTGNTIRTLSFNTSGSHLMVINGNKQINFIDRDGARNLLTVKGYMWVKDLNLTKGHTNTVHDGQFHPFNNSQFVTASADTSIRMWDIEQKLQGIEQQLAHKTLIRCKDARGGFVGATGVCYSKDGKMLFSGCLDGSLQIFSTKNNLHRPELLVRDAHVTRQQYTSIVSFDDGIRLATRNTDGTLKVWDTRKINKPIMHERELYNRFPGSKICFSPDNSLLVVGTAISPQSEQKSSYLHFYNTTTLKKVKSLQIGKNSVYGLCWSPSINQIVVGLANGEAQIYFDERLSKMGALKAVNKQPRVQKDPILGYSAPVYNPHSLPLYKQKMTNNPNKDKILLRRDHILSANPQFPKQGPHKFGRQNEKAFTFIQDIIQRLNQNPEKVEDARKPLWQLQKYSKDEHQFTDAYKFTQPDPIFHENPADTKQFQFLASIQKICPHCGKKLCTCARKQVYDSQDEQDEDDLDKTDKKKW